MRSVEPSSETTVSSRRGWGPIALGLFVAAGIVALLGVGTNRETARVAPVVLTPEPVVIEPPPVQPVAVALVELDRPIDESGALGPPRVRSHLPRVQPDPHRRPLARVPTVPRRRSPATPPPAVPPPPRRGPLYAGGTGRLPPPTQAQARAVMAMFQTDVAECADGAHGSVTIDAMVQGNTGHLERTRVSGSFAGTVVETCVLRVMRRVGFLLFNVEEVPLNHTFTF